MSKGNYSIAIQELKSFERKDVRLQARAAVNLSFLHLLEGDVVQAGKYAALAVKTDRYNARALVNMGNCLLEEEGGGEGEGVARAKELYLEAIGVEADCCEAIYNLGLVSKRSGSYAEALQAFDKLHTLVPSSPEVLFQLATLHEAQGQHGTAIKYLKHLSARLPNDPGVLSRLGAMQAGGGEGAGEGFHYHTESYRVWPVDLEVLSWLGVWYVQQELYEQAVELFARASEVQPSEPKWRLMVASCYRRSGAVSKALHVYEAIHDLWPDNMECLRYLVALCREHRREGEAQVYQVALSRLERLAGIAEASQRVYEGQEGQGQQQGQQQGQGHFAAPSMSMGMGGGGYGLGGQGSDGGGAEEGGRRDDFEGADIDDLLA
jgi:intraflagellar transport protein 88